MAGRRPQTLWLAAAGLALVLAASAASMGSEAVLEAWLFGFIAVAGLAAGSLALLMIGHILGEFWLAPVRDELEAAAGTMPLIALLAVPVLLGQGALYPAADGAAAFAVRAVAILLLWSAVALWVIRSRAVRRASAIGLALLAPSAALAVADWLLLRDPAFGPSLLPLAVSAGASVAALALCLMVTLLRPGALHPERLLSLERTLLVLVLLVPWIWFTQFLIVWMADLPNEAAWYLGRSGAWLAPVGLALAALGLAALLLIPSVGGPRRVIVAASLVLLQHAAAMLWLVRPVADAAALTTVPAAIAAAWSLAFAAGLRPGDPAGAQGASPARS